MLAIRKREERQRQMERMKRSGRVIDPNPQVNTVNATPPPPVGGAAALPAATVHMPPGTAKSVAVTPSFEDDPGEVEPGANRAEKERIWKNFVNRALLLVEIAAVLGLVFIGVTLFNSIGTLERETASAQEQANQMRQTSIPTLAPTPQLRLDQIVLPSGHTPPTSPGGGQFNFNEIPSNMLPLVQSQIMQPVINRPVQTKEMALRLIIPKLAVDETIVQGVDWDALKQGVGQLPNGVNPGDEHGNVVLAAHNDIYAQIFRYLDKLDNGDQFQIQTQTQLYTYVVTDKKFVKPTDVDVLNDRGKPTVTLVSCYPYQVDTQRIVILADRVDA